MKFIDCFGTAVHTDHSAITQVVSVRRSGSFAQLRKGTNKSNQSVWHGGGSLWPVANSSSKALISHFWEFWDVEIFPSHFTKKNQNRHFSNNCPIWPETLGWCIASPRATGRWPTATLFSAPPPQRVSQIKKRKTERERPDFPVASC